MSKLYHFTISSMPVDSISAHESELTAPCSFGFTSRPMSDVLPREAVTVGNLAELTRKTADYAKRVIATGKAAALIVSWNDRANRGTRKPSGTDRAINVLNVMFQLVGADAMQREKARALGYTVEVQSPRLGTDVMRPHFFRSEGNVPAGMKRYIIGKPETASRFLT